MNRIIKLLILADIFVLTGFGLVEPILAIFIKDNLADGTIFAAGIASTLFLLTKSLVQLPFSKYVDKYKNNERWIVLGTFLIAIVPFIYIFATKIIYIYLAQILFGLGSGLAYPAWLGLWTLNLDKNHESYQWSLYSTLTSLGTACSGAVGAAIAEFLGFQYTFIVVGALSLIGCLILLGLQEQEKKILSRKNGTRRNSKK